MKIAIDQLLQEYLLSKDVTEAVRCIAELNSPLYFHEIIKRAVSNAMDKPTSDQECMSALLQQLSAEQLLSSQQAEKGFNRLHRLLPDLALDSPSAVRVVENFTLRAKRDGVLPAAYSAPAVAAE
jgi:hypothetical protein